jgi:uncharacterized protein (DUF1778 family)
MTEPKKSDSGEPVIDSADIEMIDPGPEPVIPVRKRRILTAKLDGLDPRIAAKAREGARKCVTEIGRFRASGVDVQGQSLEDVADESVRVFYREVVKQLDKADARKEKFGKARKRPRPKEDSSAKGINLASVKDSVGVHITQGKKIARPYGQQKGGASLEEGHVLALNPVIKIGSQTEQLLGRISQLFMNKVNDMEYESMLVNQRVFVSANAQASVTEIAKFNLQSILREAAQKIIDDNAESSVLRQYSVGALAAALDSIDPLAELTKQQERGAELLSELAVGHHIDASVREELQGVLKVVQHQIRNRLKLAGPLTPDQAAAAITDDAYLNQVIAVMPPDDFSHAEQYLALALVKAKYTGRAVISGTKNPCSCCWLTLTLVLQNGFDLKFNPTAGLYWPKAARGVRAVADALGISDVSQLMEYFKDANNLTNENGDFLQHLTALREAGLIVKIPEKGGGLAGRGLTQDQSARSVYMVDNPSFSAKKLPDSFADYPGSPVHSYGSPRREDDAEVDREESEIEKYQREHAIWLEKQKKAEEQKKSK